jgi:hypothetical protein
MVGSSAVAVILIASRVRDEVLYGICVEQLACIDENWSIWKAVESPAGRSWRRSRWRQSFKKHSLQYWDMSELPRNVKSQDTHEIF